MKLFTKNACIRAYRGGGIFRLLLALFSFAALNSCLPTGLGEEVDLEAPVLKVTELISDGESVGFNGGAAVKKNAIFRGTATDNNRVERVTLQVKWSDDDDYRTVKTTSVSGEKWEMDYEFEKEDICFVFIVAEDPAGNYSAASARTIPLRVDNSAPVASGWYIDRNLGGIQFDLHTREHLESLDLDDAQNKDAAQNVAFSIYANATDLFGIKKDGIYISIRNANNEEICRIDNSAGTGYAPEFIVTHDDLKDGKDEFGDSLASGMHYLHVLYYAEDDVDGMPNPNKTPDGGEDAGWFIWWPESDEPRITSKNPPITSEGGTLGMTMKIKGALNLSLFDDDGLEKAYLALLTSEETKNINWDEIEKNPEKILEYVNEIKDEAGNVLQSKEDAQSKRTKSFAVKDGRRERETNITLTAADTPQDMRLIAVAWDSTEKNVKVTKDVTVHVIDDTKPVLLITSPKNNSVPVVYMPNDTSAVVTITGQTLDSLGCSSLEFLWVPDKVAATGKRDYAEKWFAGNPAKEKGAYTFDNGLRLWSVSLGSESSSDGFVTNNFSFTVDLLGDFKFGDVDEKAESKYFCARLIRKDGNTVVYQDYTLAADDELPEIRPVTPSADMTFHDTEKNLELKFEAVKKSGLKISNYKIELVGYELSDASAEEKVLKIAGNSVLSETNSYTFKTEYLKYCHAKGIIPRFNFYATDLFGLTGYAQYGVSLTDQPAINSISTTSPTLLKAGDTLTIDVTFSKAVSVPAGSKLYIELKNITRKIEGETARADYAGGSGTVLSFKYTVAEGDYTKDGTYVAIIDDNNDPIKGDGKDSISKFVESYNSTMNKVDSKKIKIDGVPPKGELVFDAGDADKENKHGSNTYLREGRTLTAELNADEKVTVQGSPVIVLSAGSSRVELPFTGTKASNSGGTVITFRKRIVDDPNAELRFDRIENIGVIKDAAGNALKLSNYSDGTKPTIGYVIDTKAPDAPTITDEDGNPLDTGKKYNKGFNFKIAVEGDDISETKYSFDDGLNWKGYTTGAAVKVAENAHLTAKCTDYAGNESPNAEPVLIDFRNKFPSYQIDCTNADGNYPAGGKLTFVVRFEDTVLVPSPINNNSIYIQLTGLKTGDKVGNGVNNGRAYIVEGTIPQDRKVTQLSFIYQIQDPDEFSPQVLNKHISLKGFIDDYNVEWAPDSSGGAALEREGIRCDGVAPKVMSMAPGGEKGAVYTEGNKITLVFSEPVQKSSGNITLRQKAGWAIPPVLSGDDFDTIMNKLNGDDKDILSWQENGADAEDVEDLVAGIKYPNDTYHGTGQFIGPYKKSSHGITAGGAPDTNTKYVLDFNFGIWETTEVHYIGYTFVEGYAKQHFNPQNSKNSRGSEFVNPVDLRTNTPFKQGTTGTINTKTRTVNQIREVLEKAGYHERVLDVTSTAVKKVNENTFTIEFPAGLCDGNALPDGREWELVIDKGAFMDMTGNNFGAEADGTIADGNLIQYNGTSETDNRDAYWKRAGVTEKKKVLIGFSKNNLSFFSDKVATPWVRVDRYSYGLGIYQPNNACELNLITDDNIAPSGYVRVRVDCETKGAIVQYETNIAEANQQNESDAVDEEQTEDGSKCESRISSTTLPTSVSSYKDYTINTIFVVGRGDYKKSFKALVAAKGTKTGFTDSDEGKEGVFQTVVRIHNASGNTNENSTNNSAGLNKGHADLSIRGTTGWAGEPSISPFPLRDSRNGSPYLRRTYNEYQVKKDTANYDYYWVSYEILVDSSFSGYSWWNYEYYDWCKNWGYMRPGENTYCTGLRNWG